MFLPFFACRFISITPGWRFPPHIYRQVMAMDNLKLIEDARKNHHLIVLVADVSRVVLFPEFKNNPATLIAPTWEDAHRAYADYGKKIEH